MTKPICPICEGVAVPARGPVDSEILVIGEFPGEQEMLSGKPFVGGAGAVLRQEFNNNNIDLGDFRLTNLWVHPPNDNEDCLKFGMGLIKDEAKGKKVILLIGSDTVSRFTDYNVSDVSGLAVESEFFKKADLVMAMYNPAIVFHKAVGEIRLAVKNFSIEVQKRGLIHEEEWD